MSGVLIGQACLIKNISPLERQVLIILSDHASYNGHVRMSAKSMVSDCYCSLFEYEEAITEVKGRGYLKEHNRRESLDTDCVDFVSDFELSLPEIQEGG